MLREYPEAPIVGASAIIIRGDRVLLIRRGNDPDRGRWSIPGGAVELGETLQQAVLREVREECGLDVEIGDIVNVYDLIIPDGEGRIRFHYVLIHFVAHYRGGEPTPASDALEMTWASEEELPQLDMPDRIRQAISKVLAKR